MNPDGRPSKIHDKEITKRLLDNIRIGMPIKYAAIEAGIDDKTYYNWKKRGEQGDAEYVQFFRHLKQAQSQGMKLSLQNVQVAANPEQFKKENHKGQWQAAAWILERRWKADFGRDAVPVPEEKQEGIDLSVLSDEDLKIVQGILEKHGNKSETNKD